MYILNIARAIKKMSVNETLPLKTIIKELDFLREKLFNERLGKNIYCCLQTIESKKNSDPYNTKEHYQSFIRKSPQNQQNNQK